jgi:hypothetical protein
MTKEQLDALRSRNEIRKSTRSVLAPFDSVALPLLNNLPIRDSDEAINDIDALLLEVDLLRGVNAIEEGKMVAPR